MGFTICSCRAATLCLADLDTEPGTFHPADMADVVHHHGFNRERLERQLADAGFSEMKDTTALKFSKAGRRSG